MRSEESLGQLVQYLLYHLKSIEVRLDWSTFNFKRNEKREIQIAIKKAQMAVDTVISMCKNKEVIDSIKKDLEKVDLVYYMTLTEQLFTLNTETLEEVTNLIDDYLIQKHAKEKNMAGACSAAD